MRRVKFKKGDRVRCLTGWHDIPAGAVGVVAGTRKSIPLHEEKKRPWYAVDWHDSGLDDPGWWEAATPEEVKNAPNTTHLELIDPREDGKEIVDYYAAITE